MDYYTFRVYRPGRAVWTRKSLWACSLHEAAEKIDEWCAMHGYIDYVLEEYAK